MANTLKDNAARLTICSPLYNIQPCLSCINDKTKELVIIN